MKNLRLIQFFILTLMMASCDKDEVQTTAIPDNPGVNATINGGTYSNYAFENGVYQITKGANSSTLSIDAADTNGDQITLFLNGTGGFNSGAIKIMGDVDSNSFMTYVLIRQQNPEMSYYSSTGTVSITDNRVHPTEAGARLISGNFNISASSVDATQSTEMTGAFVDLSYSE